MTSNEMIHAKKPLPKGHIYRNIATLGARKQNWQIVKASEPCKEGKPIDG